MKAKTLPNFMKITWRLIFIAILILGYYLPTWPAPAAKAGANIQVNSTADTVKTDGFCTLREAIIAANKDLATSGNNPGECIAGSGSDTITLPGGTYTLTRSDNGKEDAAATGDLDITAPVTIQATGPVTITAVSGFGDRIFQIFSGVVTLQGVTIQNGNPAGDGGGFYNLGTLTLLNSTVAGNQAGGNGGAIYNAGSLALKNVTLSGNLAKAGGGGIYNAKGTATLNNVTIANNTADSDANESGDGGGIFTAGGVVTVSNTIVGANLDISSKTKQQDCSGALASQDYNLIQNITGCTISGATTHNKTGADPLLGPLASNGGPTQTIALKSSSPAIDAGNPALPGSSEYACEATDQRGSARPSGSACDMGAYELLQAGDPAQTGPVFTVNKAADTNNGVCSVADCTFREAIAAANTRPNGPNPDEVVYLLPTGTSAISLSSPLPAITSPVVIDGTTVPGGILTLDGSQAGTADGLTFNTGGSAVTGLIIKGFSGAGVLVNSGSGVSIRGNLIYHNGGLGIDLGGDGVTPNEAGDADSGPNNLQNYPVLLRSSGMAVEGRLNSTPTTTFTLDFYANDACDPSGYGEGQTFLGNSTVTTDATGDVYFKATLSTPASDGQFITATATSPDGSTSEFSACIAAGQVNDSWPGAMKLVPANSAEVHQSLDKIGQSRWYKFSISPGSKVLVTLTGLPANYDLTLYKDIKTAFKTLTSPQDLVRLGAEFAPDAFSPDAFSPDAFSPDAFSPDAFSPDAFSPDAFSPDAFSPDAFSPDAFSPDAFSPDAFSPDAFSPDAFSPDAFSPDAFSPDAFSSAQTRSLIAISAFEGTASEGVLVNTWDKTGEFYVRVRGRNGAFNPGAQYKLTVTLLPQECSNISANLPALSTNAVEGGYKTLILTDLTRFPEAPIQKLNALASRPEVKGFLLDVGTDARVAAANLQADKYTACPQAKNLVANSIKDLVNRFWAVNPLEYVVIVGNDGVIPFFRHPDQALLANEKNYVPPVKDSTPSQASLRLGYFLSQDDYGAKFDVSFKDDNLPVPTLAVGRLVETAPEVSGMIDAYLGTAGGVVPTPTTSLVTGYDFLADVAGQVQSELAKGTGTTPDALINPREVSPLSPTAWTANDLRGLLLGSRHDLIFLAGHFSAASALAADYSTRLLASEVVASSVSMTNTIIFSAGCHAGYNIIDGDAVSGVTQEPDWAQAFARKGATLIAGTGYQYGDTDFIEYSERLYLEFSKELKAGTGPVSIGKALTAAKQDYLAGTPALRDIHVKAMLESTLFGLPMLSVNLPKDRGGQGGGSSIVPSANGFSTNPGLTLGLQSADVTLAPDLTNHTVQLTDPSNNTSVTATYLSGKDGVATRPAEPVLPLEVNNVSVAGTVLRGVGFRGGNYTDTANTLPLLGAATTEVRGVHTPFLSDIFYPVSLWNVNYFDALTGASQGGTRLMVTPAQFQSTSPGSDKGNLRAYSSLAFRLYYSGNIATFNNSSTPALAAAPSIVKVTAIPSSGQVFFQVRAVGNPAAGIQEVWVTYTATSGPFAGKWQSLDLTQSSADSTLWQNAQPFSLNGTPPGDFRFIVQAVNGVGLVSMATNQGRYYIPGQDVNPTVPTSLSIEAAQTSGSYGEQASFSAVLTSNGTALPGQPVFFGLGPQRRLAFTDSAGRATATIPLLGIPGPADQNILQVSFPGTDIYLPASASQGFTITKQSTSLSLQPQPAKGYAGSTSLLAATLKDGTGRPLTEKTVFFLIQGSGGSASVAAITNLTGQAVLGNLNLPPGSYTVQAFFSGSITLTTGETLNLDDERYTPSSTTGSLTLLAPPDCSGAQPSTVFIWPPNGNFVPVNILGVTDPTGNPITITITSIFQDEPVGTGTQSPDGSGIGTSTAQVRSERDGTGDGRVYHISFTASNGKGGVCYGEVLSAVSDNQGLGINAIDQGPLYDSTIPGP